jgi:hypothetical protein
MNQDRTFPYPLQLLRSRAPPTYPEANGGIKARYFFRVLGKGLAIADAEGTALFGSGAAIRQAPSPPLNWRKMESTVKATSSTFVEE